MVVWVYGQENNEWITRFVDPVRKTLTSKLPPPALRAASAVPAAALWAAIRGVYRGATDGLRSQLPYADYWTYTRANHATALAKDGVHHTKAGSDGINQLWAEVAGKMAYAADKRDK